MRSFLRLFVISFLVGALAVGLFLLSNKPSNIQTPQNAKPSSNIITPKDDLSSGKIHSSKKTPRKFAGPNTISERDFEEWQGMLPPDELPPCEKNDGCGLAMACVDGQCAPCSNDSDCAKGEQCALEHCILDKNLSCKTRTDCEEKEFCILSGYSYGPRGNHDMRTFCQGLRDVIQKPGPEELKLIEESGGPHQDAPFDFSHLRKGLKYE